MFSQGISGIAEVAPMKIIRAMKQIDLFLLILINIIKWII